MIQCLECGEYFCWICGPQGKTGQYCSGCYRKILTGLETKSTKRISGARARAEAAGETTRSKTSEASQKTGAAAPGFPARAWSYVAASARKHFPLVLAEKEKYEGEPLLRECWYKLVAIVISGAAIWTLIACLTHQRRPWVSIVVALLVAAGTVWSLGTRFGWIVGLFAMALALLSLAIGELAVQALFRYGVIKSLDLTAVSLSRAKSKAGIYSRFYYNALVLRLLPSAVVSFLIGWWPIKKRIGWRGFRTSG
jgi:hypothetical protein